MLMWLFTRVTALAMYALVLFALIGALIMGARNNMSFADVMRWGFMPNVTHVQSTDVPELDPWATPLWKVTACVMLLVAAAHGIHGLVVIADDYIVSPRGRQVARLLSIVFLLSMSVVGVLLIWTS
jgi:succinate dehydrogenase hydrophobic anchor subunit